MQHPSAAAVPSRRATLAAAYINLIKPHVTAMLLGVTLAAMAIASHGMPRLGITRATMIGGALAAGSANAINCYWDRDIDQLMSRTRTRSLPAGRLPETYALAFGIGLSLLSLSVFFVLVNLLSALLTLSAILFYVVVYTMWLKRTTPHINTPSWTGPSVYPWNRSLLATSCATLLSIVFRSSTVAWCSP